MTPAEWLPIAFVALMGLTILAYVVLDGYDLGVGLLLAGAKGEAERDTMIASIGPFWDANETWLVLATGLLLVAFPLAHGVILGELYLPVAIMLVGLILRGVAFKFRTKMNPGSKRSWDGAFIAGSALAALSQGYMLGLYIVGFERNLGTLAFAALTALCLAAAYVLIGAAWLIMRTEGDLQRRAVAWARGALGFAALGMIAVSVVTPLVSPRIFAKWFTPESLILLAPVPIATAALFAALHAGLARLPAAEDRWSWAPFAGAIGIFVLGFQGLAFSFYPYVVPERLTVWQAASAPESLMIIFVGTLVVLPIIIAYTIFSYRVFRGKAAGLTYY
jgi:cytochrome d ubiquinol oxidase subunit II